jgi:hypothetical protein
VCGSTPNVKQQVNDVTPISTLLFLWGPLPLYRSTSLPLYRSTALPLYLSTPLPLYLPLQRSSALALYLYLSTSRPLYRSTSVGSQGVGWGGLASGVAAWPLPWAVCRKTCVYFYYVDPCGAANFAGKLGQSRKISPLATFGHLWPPAAVST